MKFSSHFLFPCSLLLGSFALSSCGGDDGSPSGGNGGNGGSSPPPAAETISFTSSNSVSVPENTDGTIYTATATSSKGNPVTITMVSGKDSGQVLIDAQGHVSFAGKPNYELPKDENQDNRYEVDLLAKSGSASKQFTLQISVTNQKEGIAVHRVLSGLGTMVAMSSPRNRLTPLNLLTKDGKVYAFSISSGALKTLGETFTAGETGTASAILTSNSTPFILGQTQSDGIFIQKLGKKRLSIAPAMDMQPRIAAFIAGEYYVAIGDPSGSFAQKDGSNYGKLLKFNYDPYAGASLCDDCYRLENFEIAGKGLHAPSGGNLINSKILVTDQGKDLEEELNLFAPNTLDLNFMWPYREGTQVVQTGGPSAFTGPSVAYKHGKGNREGSGIVAGGIYDGSIASIANHYIFADESGKIWSLPSATLTNGYLHQGHELHLLTSDFTPDEGKIDHPVALITVTGGYIFILDQDGELFEIAPES